jgi:hypothetical protein
VEASNETLAERLADADDCTDALADALSDQLGQNEKAPPHSGYGHGAGVPPHMSAASCDPRLTTHRPGEFSSRKSGAGTLVSFVSDAGIGPVRLAFEYKYLQCSAKKMRRKRTRSQNIATANTRQL